jgi:hypothetical protein
MDDSTSSTIGSSSASSRSSLLDTNIGSSSSSIGPQNPSLALPPKPKKIEQTSMVWEHFTKLEASLIINHSSIIVRGSSIVTLEAMILHLCYSILGKAVKNIMVGLIRHNQS